MDRPRILIVDDEPANLTVLSQMLNQEFIVSACKSGEQALRFVATDPVLDLILLDVMMPGMDGYHVLERLRENTKMHDVPTIFVTALDDALDEEKGLRLGAVDYLTKPVKPAILLARVKAHLEIKQSRDRLKNQNAWLEAEVARRTRENLLIQEVSLSVILELAETRDSDTGNHISRTQAYVESLARQMQVLPAYSIDLQEQQLQRIIKAAPLHDIGKIGIPDQILLKPSKLAPDEWAIMKTHARIGGEAIRRAIDKSLGLANRQAGDYKPESLAVLEVAQCIATLHHEKWDGSGYPDGLAGTSIPLPARLMALADVYDALTSPRVYKKPWSAEEAAHYILEQRGLHFDPDVVDSFVSVQKKFADIQNIFDDSRNIS